MVLSHLAEGVHFFLDIVLPRSHFDKHLDSLTAGSLEKHAHHVLYHEKVECHAPLVFTQPAIRKTIHAAKYRGHKRAAQILGEALAPFLADVLAEQELFGLYEAPIVVPIPLHAVKTRARGFNQSERIAEALARAVSSPPLMCRTDILLRAKNTRPQARLSRKERLGNMRGAFSVVDTRSIQNADIILVDDVVTTGATMQSAKQALLDAGARSVLCVAVAH